MLDGCRPGGAQQLIGALLALEFGLVHVVGRTRGLYGVAALAVLSACFAGCYIALAWQRAPGTATRFAGVLGILLVVATLWLHWRREPLTFPVVENYAALKAPAVYAAVLLSWGWIVGLRPPGRFLIMLGIALFGCFLVGQLWRSPHPLEDVPTVSTEATQRLLSGGNPYTALYTDVFEQAGYSRAPYAMHYVYLPGLMLHFAIPVALGLDVRWAGLAMQVAGLALFASCVPLARHGRKFWAPLAAGAAVLLFWVQNGQALLLEHAWAESLVLFYLCLALWAWRKSGWVVAIALTLAFCSKQTAWFCGPFFIALAIRERRWRLIAAVAAGSVVLLAPFFLWNPAAFFRNVIIEHLGKSPRPDGLSWPAFFLRNGPGAVPWVAALSFLAYAFAFGAFIAQLRRPERDGLMEAHKWMVLGMFGLLLFANQAFSNYYYLMVGLLAFYIVRCAGGEYAPAAGSELPAPLAGRPS